MLKRSGRVASDCPPPRQELQPTSSGILMYSPTHKKSLLSLCAAGALLFSTSAFSFNPPEQGPGGDTANPCQADCGFERGPVPTKALLEAETGPFAVSSQSVGRGNGFSRGTLYYPQGTTGTLGAIAVVPGFVSP